MFLDASIVVAVIMHEEGWEADFSKLLAAGGPYFYSPMVGYEAVVAIARISQLAKGVRVDAALLAEAEAVFDDFMQRLPAKEIEITPEIGKGALMATRTYGKAVGHKAALNFGDCFSYAAAKALGVGLLYKGNDFALTDLS